MAGNGEESGISSLNLSRPVRSDGIANLHDATNVAGIEQNRENENVDSRKPLAQGTLFISSTDEARKYGCLRDIFRQQVVEAKEVLRCADTPIMQLNDCRQDLRRLVEDMQRYALAVGNDSYYMTDFLSRRSEAATIVAQLAERLDSREQARSRDRLKLTPVKTPKFGGLISDYLAFKAEFQDVIVSRASDRVALLKLREEALRSDSVEYKVVAGCRTLSEAFDELDAFFGNSEVQRNALLVQLRQLPPVTDLSDSHGLRVIYTTLQMVMKQLALIQDCELLDSAIFSALMLKIPNYMARKIDEKIADENVRGTQDRFRLFISACKRHATVTDLHHYRTKAYGPDTPKSGRDEFSSRSSVHLASMHGGAGKASQSTCLFHENAKRHPTSACSKLFQLSDEDIFARLKDGDHCFRCFNKHKAGKSCNVVCTHADCPCPDTHGKLLHSIFTRQADPLSGVPRQLLSRDSDGVRPEALGQLRDCVSDTEDECLHSYSDNTSYDSDASVGSNVAALSVTQVPFADQSGRASSREVSERLQAALGAKSIRPCHEAFVKAANGQLIPVNLFYDLGSDISQITWDCAARAALQPVATVPSLQLHVAGAKEAVRLGESALFDVPFRNSSGSIIFTSTCTTVPYIGKLRAASDDVIFRQFRNSGQDCSDAIPAVSGVIDCLIGVNHSEVHPRPIASIGSMTLAQTRFGKVVYGSHPDVPSGSVSAGCYSVGAQTEGRTELPLCISEKVQDLLDGIERETEISKAACHHAQQRSLVKVTAKSFSQESFKVQSKSAKRSSLEVNLTVVTADNVQPANQSLCYLAGLPSFFERQICLAPPTTGINPDFCKRSLLNRLLPLKKLSDLIAMIQTSEFGVSDGAEWLQRVMEMLWDPGGAHEMDLLKGW